MSSEHQSRSNEGQYDYIADRYGQNEHNIGLHPGESDFASPDIVSHHPRYRLPVLRAFLNWHCQANNTSKVPMDTVDQFIREFGITTPDTIGQYKQNLDSWYADIDFRTYVLHTGFAED